jgi:uracil-DNA glycosylase family 4
MGRAPQGSRMAWSERQHRMLRAMGLRMWSPPTRATAAAPELAQATASVASAATAAVHAEPATRPPAVARPAAPANQVAPVSVQARPDAAIAAMDWPTLRDAVAGCRACALCDSRRQTVFGTGHPQARWLVVGEAPGEQEDETGEPFVGAAGQLLDRMLAALQLTRATDGPQPPEQRVYIANTLKCRPPRNRNPLPEESAQCEPYLVRQIELLQPRIILALGRFAVQSLLRSDEPIGRLRGQVHRYQGVPLVVTYHPAYLLRTLTDKAKAWEDLCLAAQVAEQGPNQEVAG